MAVNWGGVAGMIVFYLIILVVGLWASRKNKGKTDSERAMVGDRSFGWFVGVLTLIATWVGGGYINGTAEVMFTPGLGLVWAQAPWCYSLSFIVNGLFFAEKMRAANYVTMLDPFSIKYGARMGGFLFLAALMGELLWCAAILAALGSTMSIILDIDRIPAVIISACIAAAYTLFGGLYSVAYTDIAQLFLVFFGLWLSLPFAFTHPAVSPIKETKDSWLGEWDNKLAGQWVDSVLLLLFGGVPWQAYYQRALSCKTPGHAKNMTIVAAFGCLLFALPAYLAGIIGASTDWTKTSLDLNETNIYEDPAVILPVVMQYLTPAAVSFFGLGAISAAVMSSTDSSILSSSSMFVRNVYRNIFRQKASETELMWVMRCTILVVAACATILALTVESVYSLFVLCGDFVYVILFPQLTCVVHVAKSNTYGSAMGFIVGLVLRLGGGEPALKLPPFIKYPYYDEEHGQLFPFRTLAMLCSLVTLLIVSFATDITFRREWLDKKWDFFKCVTNVEEEVEDDKKTDKWAVDGDEAKTIDHGDIVLEKEGKSNPVFEMEMKDASTSADEKHVNGEL